MSSAPPNIRVTVYDPTGSTVLALDASSDIGRGILQYSDGPDGCLAAKIPLILRYEDVWEQGIWTEFNIVELSSGDNVLQTSVGAVAAAGTGKYYLDTNWGFDPAVWLDTQQAFFDDGVHLTMRCPVISVGTDGGGQYIIVGTPLGGGGIPAYNALQTTVGRRRYSGRIARRDRINQKLPDATITCVGMYQSLAQQEGDFTVSTTAAQDIGTVIYDAINLYAYNLPFLTINSGNFPTLGQNYSGTYQSTMLASFISNVLQAVETSSSWHVRVGHDRIPRLVKLFDSGTDLYTYNVTVHQSAALPQAYSVNVTDADISQFLNRIKVTGDTNPSTGIPVSVILQDQASHDFYGFWVDGSPIQVAGLKTVNDCLLYAQSQLDQFSLARSNQKLTVYTRRNDAQGFLLPGNMATGDVLPPVANITATDFTPSTMGGMGTPPDISGLAVSITTNIDCDKTDTWQDAQFSAILPPWSTAIGEKANALATALLVNTSTGNGVDQYAVDPTAYPFSSSPSSLVVTTPTFPALFAPGTMPVTCGGNTFTLAANATNWVYLHSNNTWTVTQYAATTYDINGTNLFTPPGATILYAFFKTNATGVTGSSNLAALIQLRTPLSYLLNGTVLTPTLSGISITSSIPGQISSQITIMFEVTNQPTNGSFSKLICYYKQAGQTYPLILAQVPPNDHTGTPQNVAGPFDSTGLYTFLFPDATNGISYEFGVAMESGASTETAYLTLGTFTTTPIDTVGLVRLANGDVGVTWSPPSNTFFPCNFQNAVTLLIPGNGSQSYFVQLSAGPGLNVNSSSPSSSDITYTLSVQSGTVSNFTATSFEYNLGSPPPLQAILASFTASGGQTVVLQFALSDSHAGDYLPAGNTQVALLTQVMGSRLT